MVWLFTCICVTVHLRVSLTTLCDVVNAAVNDDRYVCLCELLLAQCISSTSCCCLDGTTPSGKIQLSLSLYVQGPKNIGNIREMKKSKSLGKNVKKIFMMKITFKKINTLLYYSECMLYVGTVEQTICSYSPLSPAFLDQNQHLIVLLNCCETQIYRKQIIPDSHSFKTDQSSQYICGSNYFISSSTWAC